MPEYSLKLVKEKVRSGDWHLTPTALNSAWDDFMWSPNDVGRCLLKLSVKKHFHKSDIYHREPHIILDVYRGHNLMDGEDVYTHFYVKIENGALVVNSFHQLD